ncbi:hypothetical protein [Nitrospira sp. Kam-Ns4a]
MSEIRWPAALGLSLSLGAVGLALSGVAGDRMARSALGEVSGEAASAAGPAGHVTQLTSPAGDCSYLSPQLSGNGQWLVAIAVCPPGPTGRQDHRIVRIERATGEEQVLTPPGAESFSPSVSDDGRRVAFVSTADLALGQNPSHLEQVFLFDDATRRYTQVTQVRASDSNRTVQFPRLSGDGQWLIFASDADLVPGENRDGNTELFLFDVPRGTLRQVTHTEGPARHERPLISRDGQTVAFVGVHPPLDRRIRTGLYLWSRTTGAVRRLAQTPTADAGAFAQLVMAGDGTRLAFAGRFDLLGENPDRNIELFAFEVEAGLPRQLTHTHGCASANPALSADGRTLLFISNCRFDGLNPELHTDVFLMRVETGTIIRLTDSGTVAVAEAPALDRTGRLAAVSFGAELKGMVNPKRLLQVALLTLPPLAAVAETPPRWVAADEVSAVVISRHEPDTLYLASPRLGVMKSEDGGHSWRLFSYALGTEAVTCLVEHPERAGLLIAGTRDAGVYKTLNQTGLWVSGQGLADQRILGLAIDPVYSDVLYVDTPSGLFRSTDLGDNWEPVQARLSADKETPPASPVRASEPLAPPAAANTLVPVSGTAGRLLRLTPAGLLLLSGDAAEWVQVQTPLPPQWVVVGPRGTPWFIGTSRGIFRADRLEGGWRPVAGLPEERLPPVTFTAGGTMQAAARGWLYQSLDRGETWTRLASLEGLSRLLPEQAPSGLLLAALEHGGLALSSDGGRAWTRLRIPAPSPQGLKSVLMRPAR